MHLLMARSVPGNPDILFDTSSVNVNGMGLASQSHSVAAAAGRGVGPKNSELWVSGNGATNHINNDSRNVNIWVAITPVDWA